MEPADSTDGPDDGSSRATSVEVGVEVEAADGQPAEPATEPAAVGTADQAGTGGASPAHDRPDVGAAAEVAGSASPDAGGLHEVLVETTAMAVGGEAVARDETGRVVFVRGALPGELVRARVVEAKRSFARADLQDVLRSGEGRVEPPCPEVANGCGGCDLQHATVERQRALKEQVVVGTLARIAHLHDVQVTTVPLAADGFRTTVRAAVAQGRAGFRRRRGHQVVTPGACLVAHPLVEELLVDGRFGPATEVTLRVGARTGERMAVVWPRAEDVTLPDDVLVVGGDELRSGRRAWIHEEVAGRTWRISAGSFFQSRPDGAEALVAQVRDAVAETGAETGAEAERLVDLCAGVGLFAGTVAAGSATAVESNRSAVADARQNLSDRPAKVVSVSVERWRPSHADVVVADPPRTGLGRTGVAAVTATGARRVALVSCDPAAMARDAGLLVGAGYRLERVALVDLFTHTSHIEAVSRFTIADQQTR